MIYATVDFEAINTIGEWWACGVVLAEYPSRKVLFAKTYVCRRPLQKFDPVTLKFWNENPSAFHFLRDYPQATSVQDAENNLCKDFRELVKKFPKFFFVSDNPQFDVALLDQILLRGSLPTVAHRCPPKYLHTTCTRSFHQAMRIMNRGVCYLKPRGASELLRLTRACKHTPLCDAATILLHHFEVLEAASSYRPNFPNTIAPDCSEFS